MRIHPYNNKANISFQCTEPNVAYGILTNTLFIKTAVSIYDSTRRFLNEFFDSDICPSLWSGMR